MTIQYNGATDGTTEVIKINPSTMNLDSSSDKMKMKMSIFQPRGFGRILYSSGDIWFILPTLVTASSKQSIFFTKFTDVTTMTWI